MPPEDGVGLDDEEDRPPSLPEPRQPDSEDPVTSAQSEPLDGSAENRQLLAQGEDLGSQGGAGKEERTEEQEQFSNNAHRAPSIR